MWNQLLTVIKLSGRVNIFKENLKTHLFTQTLTKLAHMLTIDFMFVCYVYVFKIIVLLCLLLLCMLFLIFLCSWTHVISRQRTEQVLIELDISAIEEYNNNNNYYYPVIHKIQF